MRKCFYLLFCLLSITLCSQTRHKALVDSLRYVEDIPYIGNCKNIILGNIIREGLDIVPFLIEKMTDTDTLNAGYVRHFHGKYTVADVAYIAIEEIIHDIPTFELIGIPFSDVCGYCSYWYHVRKSKKNRRKFQKATMKWYNDNKDKLVWVESKSSSTSECFSPAGGHYEIKK